MVTVDFKDILYHVADNVGLDQVNIQTEEYRIIRDGVSDGLQRAWEVEKWPDLLRVEKRYFRDIYDNTVAYAIGKEVYYPKKKLYYHTIKASTGNVPTTLGSWAESLTQYSADDYDNAKAYAVGDHVYYPDDDKYYHCHTASTGNLPTATGFWGPLIAFDRYVAFEQTSKTKLGEVFWSGNKNRRVFTNFETYFFQLSDLGVQILDAMTEVWLEFRIRVPRLFGESYDSAKTYAIGDQIYFASKNNFYDNAVATVAGESPTSAPTKWTIVDIPYLFKQALISFGTARFLESDGQHEKAALEYATADNDLGLAADKLFRQQQQTRRLTVITR